MTGRERVLNAIDFKPVDRVPVDLGGMLSTGINAFVYLELVHELGLDARLSRVYRPEWMPAENEVMQYR